MFRKRLKKKGQWKQNKKPEEEQMNKKKYAHTKKGKTDL